MGEGTGGGRGVRVSRFLLLAAWAAVVVFALLHVPGADALRSRVEEAGAAGPAVYLVVYVVAVFALVPRPALNALAGLVFGFPLGLVLALAGGVCAALAQFAVARHVAGDAVARRLPPGIRARLDALVGGHAFVAVLQLRLLPVVPYQAVNYGLGLTRAGVWPFAAGTLAGAVPATAALVLVGSGGADLGVPVTVAGVLLTVVIGAAWWLRARSEARTGG
ncbi:MULTISPECIES: TVP38/TMEM64 family protein [Nocardiopsidaceae]|uniref:TVP38/TMEM64 family membrane protein n=1 Tax=Streptomonospora nanhaiensis TaxID=1323731 RepID=A0ABY6YTW8_9ACTN|nr:VTT domain-containing protein [Streptomonospora nanhaiensis]WAE75446.1 VTT domain-containing protein [Streptomonospora nanhaiensis]